MECKYCGAINDPGSKTCVLCGRTLEAPKEPEPLVQEVEAPEPEQPAEPKGPRTLSPEEHIRIGELIYAAYKNKEAGAVDDAILACQGALALNDASAPTHALLGSLYESKGDIPSAIFEYEKVEKLDPGNVANKQKLEALRTTPFVPPQPAKRKIPVRLERLLPYVPFAAFVLVFLAMVVVGLAVLGKNSGTSARGGYEQTGGVPSGVPQTTPPVQPYASQQPYPQGQQNEVRNQPFLGPGQVQSSQNPARQSPAQTTPPSQPKPFNMQSALPKPPVVTGPRPINEFPSAPLPSPKPAPYQPPVITPVIEPTKPPVSPPKPRPTPPPAQSAADPEERAVQLQAAGKYQDAVSAYREALNRTSDSGRIYQQIAMCYQRLGQRDQAVQNYKSAIRSYRDQLSAGRDPSEVQRNIRSCEAGIEVLSNQGH